MAKANSIQIKLVSTADTGFYYITRKNPRTLTEKMEKRKYDPVARKHVVFKEAKIKKSEIKTIALRVPKFTEASWASSQRRMKKNVGINLFDFIITIKKK